MRLWSNGEAGRVALLDLFAQGRAIHASILPLGSTTPLQIPQIITASSAFRRFYSRESTHCNALLLVEVSLKRLRLHRMDTADALTADTSKKHTRQESPAG
jgi:hypothetical protein